MSVVPLYPAPQYNSIAPEFNERRKSLRIKTFQLFRSRSLEKPPITGHEIGEWTKSETHVAPLAENSS
jgi:hypothetical protein